MALEIERRFLVRTDDWKNEVIYVVPEKTMPHTEWSGSDIIQAYFRADDTIRIRIIDGSSACIGIKIPVKVSRHDTGNLEFEYSIPLEDAQDIISATKMDVLVKRRFRIVHEHLTWEVDEFLGKNAGLVIAEVELDRPSQEITKPEWVGEEITGISRYSNRSLARFPFPVK